MRLHAHGALQRTKDVYVTNVCSVSTFGPLSILCCVWLSTVHRRNYLGIDVYHLRTVAIHTAALMNDIRSVGDNLESTKQHNYVVLAGQNKMAWYRQVMCV